MSEPPDGAGVFVPEPDPTGEAGDGAALTSGARVLGGGLWKVVSSILPQLYSLVVSVVAARYLGPHLMGRQSFIAFVELSTIGLLSGGMSGSLMRYTGETLGRGDRAGVRSLVAAAWRLELAAAAVGGAVLVGAGIAGANPTGAWVLAGVAAALGILQTVPSACLVGLQRWRQASLAGLVTGGVGSGATVLVLVLGGRLTAMFAVEAAVSAAVLAWTSRLATKEVRALAPRAVPAPEQRRGMNRFALVASVAVVLDLVVWRRSEFFFLKHYSTESEIAFYSIAFALTNALVRVPGTIGGVITPAVATLFGAGDRDRIRDGYARALRLLVLVTLPLMAGGLALGPRVVSLVWGQAYERAGDVLIVLVAASILTPLAVLSHSLLTGMGQLRVPIAADTVAACVDVGLAFLLIPRYGAIGAAFANSGAQLTSTLPLLAYSLAQTGSLRWAGGTVARTAIVAAVAAGAAAGVVHALGGWLGLVAATVVGLVVLVLLAPRVRVMTRADADWLATAAGSRLGGNVGRLARFLSGAHGQ